MGPPSCITPEDHPYPFEKVSPALLTTPTQGRTGVGSGWDPQPAYGVVGCPPYWRANVS
jgi:hypothetical protein